MQLLLDTHAFLWWAHAPEKLSTPVLEALASVENTLYLSLASVWEMQIKIGLGKLQAHVPIEQLLVEQQSNGLQLLAIEIPHLLLINNLPALHKDPFDRLLLAQAKVENMVLVTADKALQTYGIATFW